jgi:hypothetical protein
VDQAAFEQLLYESESNTLDFKRDQYRFQSASDDDQSELLKDILGFANAWRRNDAFILIGVDEVTGGACNVVGITDHLPDHSIQQFVNARTNVPVHFRYFVQPYEGLQVGIIKVDLEQERPVYLKEDFGRLKARHVYVRRGSSTDLQSPAMPDEIFRMGRASISKSELSLSVELANPKENDLCGNDVTLQLTKRRYEGLLPSGGRRYSEGPGHFGVVTVEHSGENPNYWTELRSYHCELGILNSFRIAVTNRSQCAAENIEVEVFADRHEAVSLLNYNNYPSPPTRVRNQFFVPNIRSSIAGIARDPVLQLGPIGSKERILAKYPLLQPGRTAYSERIAIKNNGCGNVEFNGHVYASNLENPIAVTLTLMFNMREETITLKDLREFSDYINPQRSK